jgi:hypothetical protein
MRAMPSAVRNPPLRLTEALLVGAAMAFAVGCTADRGDTPSGEERVAIVVIDRMTFSDLEALADSFPSFKELLDTGAVGLMNVASADGFSRSGTYSTLAAGVKAHGVSGAHTWYRHFPAPDVVTYDFGSVSATVRKALHEEHDASFFWTPAEILGDLLDQVRAGSLELLILASPTSDEVWAPSPIAICGQGFPWGTLTSGTTHTAGLVAAVDFAPTVLNAVGAPIPDSMTGLPLQVRGAADPVQTVGEFDSRLRADQRRYITLPVALGAVVPLAIIVAGAALLARRARNALARTGSLLLGLAWFLVTGLLFVFGGAHYPKWMGSILALTGFVVVVPLYSTLPPGRRGSLAIVPLLWIPLLGLVDCALGCPLVGRSILSHYALTHGLRYYGIGNQAAGIVIGSLIGGITVWAYVRRVEQPSNQAIWFFCLWAFALAIVFGYPGMGSNMGAYIAAYAMGMALLAAMRGRGLGWVRGAILIIIGAVILCSFGVIDAMREASAQTHLGRAVAHAMETGGASLWAAAARKAAQNFQIMGQPIILSLIILAVAFAVLWRLIQPWGARHERGLRLGRVALWSAAVAFVANDSGVIAASFLLAGYVVGAVEVSMARLIEEGKT